MQTDTAFDILFDKRRQEYLTEMRELFSSYMQRPKQLKTNLIRSFSSWPTRNRDTLGNFSFEEHQALFDAKNSDIQEGGYFLALNQKGICINPSGNFFEEFCQKGFSLQDIDVVIATNPSDSIEKTLTSIYNLNRESNRTLMSYGQEPHVIRFFLHPELHASVSSHLRPTIREELGSILSLETFTKSHEVRSIDDTLSLCYAKTEGDNLALRIDAIGNGISVGFISSGGYHDGLRGLFSPCSLLIAGIGECTAEDLEKVTLQKQTLGYYGLLELIQNAPNLRLALVSEFARSMGDLRLELVQKLLSELDAGPKVLPLDKDFCLNLDTLTVETHAKSYCTFDDVQVVRPNGSFAPLQFLDASDVL